MISYMPFTVLEKRHLQLLSDTLGTFTVYSPSDAIVPSHMHSWKQQGKIEIRHPEGVDREQLLIAIDNYKSWADLHQGNIGDMAGFFQSQQGRIPMMDDTNPTQIGHQIRHYGEPAEHTPDDSLFKAALFLSMAQEYDLHQYGMDKDMEAVHAMEQQMLRKLSGDAHDVKTEMPVVLPPQSSAYQTIDDPYMTAQRVQAWSRMALTDTQVPLIYLTLSKAVIDHIKDILPDVQELVRLSLSSPKVQEVLQSLAAGLDLDGFESASDASGLTAVNKNQLILYRLDGVPPVDFLYRLAAHEPVGDGSSQQGGVPPYTFIGLVNI